jgi:hypothetical protein
MTAAQTSAIRAMKATELIEGTLRRSTMRM